MEKLWQVEGVKKGTEFVRGHELCGRRSVMKLRAETHGDAQAKAQRLSCNRLIITKTMLIEG